MKPETQQIRQKKIGRRQPEKKKLPTGQLKRSDALVLSIQTDLVCQNQH